MKVEDRLVRISQLFCLMAFGATLILGCVQAFSGKPVFWWLILLSLLTLVAVYSENNYHVVAGLMWLVIFVIGAGSLIGVFIGQLGFDPFENKIPNFDFICFGVLYSLIIWLPEIGMLFYKTETIPPPHK